MPELPEVETTARLIRPGLVGRTIEGLDVEWDRSLGAMDGVEFEGRVSGARIHSVGRRAKYVVISLTRKGKPAGGILVHLRMTGRLVVAKKNAEVPAYRKVSLRLDRGVLHFLDVRKFGRFTFHEDLDGALAHLGPEPLDGPWTGEDFARELRARKRVVKQLLLDQGFLAGLGNIYVDESLYAARIHPLTPAHRISKAKAVLLFGEIQRVLSAAVEREGSSFDAFYRTPEGKPGEYQHLFQVYGRGGKECGRCGGKIRRIVVGQRGTHFCPSCQRKAV